MNFPKIYRRFAVAAVGILIVGLFPASALASDGDTFVISGPTSITATSPQSYTVTAMNGAVVDTVFADDSTVACTGGSPTCTAALLGTAFASGLATISVIGGAAGDLAITVTDDTDGLVTGTLHVTVLATGTATQLVVTPGSAQATVGVAAGLTVTAVDDFGTNDTGYAGSATLTSTDGSATLTPTDVTLSGGSGTATVAFSAAGTQTVTATDAAATLTAGTSENIDARKSQTITTAPVLPTPGLVGGTFTPAPTAPAGDVVVSADGTDTVCTLASGVITFLDAGTCKFNDDQAGSAASGYWAAPTVHQSIDVRYPTTATLVSSVAGTPGTTTYGQSITFTATVTSSSGTPSGSVQFWFGGTAVGSSVALSGGVAELTIPTLPVDTQSVTAVYAGDATYAAATSNGASQKINSADTTTVVTSSSAGTPPTSTAGDSVTFTATVSKEGSGLDPTGNVEFFDGATDLGSAALASGHADLPTSSLAIGHRSITAHYVGDSNYGGSTSTAIEQYVHGAAANLVVTGPSTATAGVPGVYTVTVEDSSGNPITDFVGSIVLTNADGAISATVHTALANGVETFDVTLDTAGANHIGATSGALTDVPKTVTVSAASASHLVITTSLSTVQAGSPRSYMVTATDPYGNTAPDYAGTVAITSSDSLAVLPASSPTFASGTATFSVTLNTVGTEHVWANAGSLPQAELSMTVNADVVTQLVITGATSTIIGVPQTYTVRAEDSSNTIVMAYNLDVTISSSDLAANLSPSHKLLTNGVGTFVVTFNTPGTKTVGAADSTPLSATPYSVSVAASGSATHFVVTGPASPAPETVQSYTVTATDSLGHTDSGYTGTVTFTSTDGAATLPGNSTLAAGTRTFSVTLMTTGTQTVTATDTVLSSITGTSNGATVTRVLSEFHPQSPPIRLLDSRTGNGMPSGRPAKLYANAPVRVQVAGRNTVGANATAVTVNAAIVYPSAAGSLFLGPKSTPNPATFTMAFNKMDITNYGVTVELSSSSDQYPGSIYATYHASGTTDLVLDITGWFAPSTTPGGETYFPITPFRALDSRIGNGLSKAKFKANVPRSFAIWGRGNAGDTVPTSARAVTGNLTAVNANYHGAVYLGPGGPSGPSATINFVAGQIRGNSITVALSSSGTLSATFEAKSGKTTDLVFDVTGYYTTDQNGSMFVPLTSAAILDTHNGIGVPAQRFAANVPHTFTVQNHAGVPVGAKGITGVVAVVHQDASYALAVGPDPSSAALIKTSSLNFIKTDNCSNGTTTALSGTGTLSTMYMSYSGATDVLIYVTGYFVKAP